MKKFLFLAVVSMCSVHAMYCPIPDTQSVKQECQCFCEQARLNDLLRDTERLQRSMSDKDFLLLIQGFAVNIERLNDILSALRQGSGDYSPMIRFRYGRELGSFLVGTSNLFVQKNIKRRLIKLQRKDLVDRFVKIGILSND